MKRNLDMSRHVKLNPVGPVILRMENSNIYKCGVGNREKVKNVDMKRVLDMISELG